MKPRLENTAASPAQIRHVCFHLETAIALMPEGVQNLAILIDFSGSSMRTNPGVAVAREIINVLGSHYPERLGKAYIIHGRALGRKTSFYFGQVSRKGREYHFPSTRNYPWASRRPTKLVFCLLSLFSTLVLLPVLQTDLTVH